MKRYLSIAVVIVAAVAGEKARAQTDHDAVEFLHAAQDRGYGEAAVAYLEKLKARGPLPEELAETWDLEMSKSWRVAMREAFNAAEADARLAKAQQYLNTFLKAHPDHPAVADALGAWGDIFFDRGLEQIRLSQRTQDKAARQKHLEAARAQLKQAEPRYRQSEEHFRKQHAEAVTAQRQKQIKSRARRRITKASDAVIEAKLAWLDSRFKLARLDYSIGQTYSDPADKQRVEVIKKAAQQFDDIFQENRGSLVGLHAHMWQGKCADEQGDDQLALDIYDEVLANVPEERKGSAAGLEPLFAQAEQFRLEIVRRKHGIKPFVVEAADWIKSRYSWRKTDGYQGIALDLVKAYLELSAKEAGQEKEKFKREAVALLAEMAKVPGEYQAEAILMARKFRSTAPVDPRKAKTFDDAMALADAAAETEDWATAMGGYEHALALSRKVRVRDKQRLEQAKLRLEHSQFRAAQALYNAGKMDQALVMLDRIASEHPDSVVAPTASSLAVSAALNLYASAKDKQAAFQVLADQAKKTIDRFGTKPEGDDARLTLGQASLLQGKPLDAIERFEAVDPRSERRPSALYLAGQTHWRMFLSEKQKDETTRDDKFMQVHIDKAQQELTESLDAQRKLPDGRASPRQLTDTQLIMGEIYLERVEPQKAMELLVPLVDAVRAAKPESLDNTMLRSFIGAIRACLASGDVKKAGEVAEVLLAAGADLPPVNAALVSFARALEMELKRSTADVIRLRAEDNPKDLQEAEIREKNLKELLTSVMTQLAKREQNSVPAMIYIADTSAALGKPEFARAMYEKVLPIAESQPKYRAAITRIRARLVGLLRQESQFAKALKEVDKLIEDNRNALEPMLEKGRILEAWAEKDSKQYPAAATHWAELRTLLGRMRKKPPEYYEVVYSTAACLLGASRATQDPARAKQAEQLLSATLVLSPKLSGPDMVARYNALLKRIRSQNAAAPKVSAAK